MDAQALGVPNFGATEPFKLFPSETIEIINSELEKHAHEVRSDGLHVLLKDTEVKFLTHCIAAFLFIEQTTFRSPPFAPCVMRGLAHKSEFIRDLWNAPQVSRRT